MKKHKNELENRLQGMKNVFNKISQILDSLPDFVPNDAKKLLKDKILGDTDLKQFMYDVEHKRPPRIMLIGRTGVGKSSMINALCGTYLAEVSDSRACTKGAEIYQCKEQDRVLLEILDTRGIAESEQLDDNLTAEDQLFEDVNYFSPDVAILMLNCTHRDSIDEDVCVLRNIVSRYEKDNSCKLPVIVVCSRADDVNPGGRIKQPEIYPQTKIKVINDAIDYFRNIIDKNGLKIEGIIPISSYIEWCLCDNPEQLLSAEDISELSEEDKDKLVIQFDGRYNIEELRSLLDMAIRDYEARMGLRMAARLTDVIMTMTNHIVSVFSAIAATVAFTPIPVSDIYILVTLQAVMVMIISILSGRELTLESAIEFIVSLGGIGGVGFVLRVIAQQGVKLANLLLPAAGSSISAGIAYLGTKSMGKAAIAYYIQNKSIEEAKKTMKHTQKHEKVPASITDEDMQSTYDAINNAFDDE